MKYLWNRLLGTRPGLMITAGPVWQHDPRFRAPWYIQRLADDLMINVWIINTIPIKHDHLHLGVSAIFFSPCYFN